MTDRPAVASVAFRSFVAAYWDGERRYFFASSDHRSIGHNPMRPDGGRYADFWWAAQLWEVVMDEAEATDDPDAAAMVDDVYDGFVEAFPTFGSDFNDDRGWWAMGATRAFEITGNGRYLDRARSLLDGLLESRDETYGGGIWWRRNVRDQKNMATNAPAAITALRLCRLTNDERYCRIGRELFAWLDGLREGDKIIDHIEGPGDGRRNGWQFSYNYGTYLRAALEMARTTGEARYRDLAQRTADRAIRTLSDGGVLRSEGDRDGGGFRGIFVRQLAVAARELGRQDLLDVLARNAASAWSARDEKGLVGASWTGRTRGPIESLTAASAVAVIQAARGIPAAP